MIFSLFRHCQWIVVLCSLVLAEDDVLDKMGLRALYKSRSDQCDFFVSTDGTDSNDGSSLEEPFKTVQCACDPGCNHDLQAGEVICLMSGTHALSSTITVKGERMREQTLKLVNIGPPGSVILDGQKKYSIFNALQTSVTFQDITFKNGFGVSSGGVYGERELVFLDCSFIDNEGQVHGGAVMGGRKTIYKGCTFQQNKARFGGAIRVNDVGSAVISDCKFIGNSAVGRGGAIATQIENANNYVAISNCLFCFNEAPMGEHIYDYKTITHKCTNCKINSSECCSNHGRVVSTDEAESYFIPEGETRQKVCQCDHGWEGEMCEIATESGPRDELISFELYTQPLVSVPS
eukprot:m.108189 g.108189  ORF g.108189 m.108189 type:complete len:348 (+) comp13953_c0_seq7:44-1087(+)